MPGRSRSSETGGWLSFITSNSFVKRRYGQGLQSYLARCVQVQSIIDFGETAIFEATVEPYVLVARKAAPAEDHRLLAHNLYPALARRVGRTADVERVREELTNLEGLLAEDMARLPQAMLAGSGWRTEDEAVLRLFERLMSQGTPLGQYVQGRMYYGIKTGLNEAFVIDQAQRDALVAADPRSAEIIKRWLRGRDIKRWKPEWAGLYLIALQNSGDADAQNPWAEARSEAEARRIFAATYPAVHDHLSAYEARLRQRADQGRFWWELRACAYYHEFERPKVLWPDISRTLRFSWEDSGAYSGNTTYFSPAMPLWFLAVMNSTVFEFLLCFSTNSIRGGFMRLFTNSLEPLPVPKVDDSLESRLRDLALAFRDGSSEEDRTALDAMASEAYGLSPIDLDLLYRWFESRSLPMPPNDGETIDGEGSGDDEEEA